MPTLHSLDRINVVFDDHHQVPSAGLILPATLSQHLGLLELFDRHIDLGEARGRANIGHKAMTLIHSILAGGDCIDDAEALRSGATGSILGHELRAPSTLGTFLRSFTWGHIRQLDKLCGELLQRAWAAGAGPGDQPVIIDTDSTIAETYGPTKQGGVFGHTKVRGYHPLISTIAGTGEVVHCRLRGGNAHSARGAHGFVTETFNRVRHGGATGALILRADSGFYNRNIVAACTRADVAYSITAKLYAPMRTLIDQLPDSAWTPIPYYLDGADVAETSYQPFHHQHHRVRLIIRRTRPAPGSQLSLLQEFSYHAFITNRSGDTLTLEADHRRHAEIENVIRDLKYGVGLNHLPSAKFAANAAWMTLNIIAHNLSRWTSQLGLGQSLTTHKTLRRRYYNLPARLTHSARQHTLHLPEHWPWRTQFDTALRRLRAITTIT